VKDSLKITLNDDGSFTFDWDREDPMWSWMNEMSDEELKLIIQEEIKNWSN
jgi:hypothetical protein